MDGFGDAKFLGLAFLTQLLTFCLKTISLDSSHREALAITYLFLGSASQWAWQGLYP